MKYHLQVVDNFFDNPDYVRNFALQQKFIREEVNYPGARTDFISNLNPDFYHYCMSKITKLYFDSGKEIIYDSKCSFQIIDNKYRKGWIHCDDIEYYDVAGVIYLTPNAPLDAGTSIYRKKTEHLKTYDIKYNEFAERQKINLEEYYKVQDEYNSQFEKTLEIGNVYNRLVVYSVEEWHAQSGFFGTTLEDSRLTQVFFIKFDIVK